MANRIKRWGASSLIESYACTTGHCAKLSVCMLCTWTSARCCLPTCQGFLEKREAGSGLSPLWQVTGTLRDWCLPQGSLIQRAGYQWERVVTAHSSWLSFPGDPTVLFLSVTGECLQPRWMGLYVGRTQIRCWAKELWSPSSPYMYKLKLTWEQMRRTPLSQHHWGPGGLLGSHCLSFSIMRIPTATLVVLQAFLWRAWIYKGTPTASLLLLFSAFWNLTGNKSVGFNCIIPLPQEHHYHNAWFTLFSCYFY